MPKVHSLMDVKAARGTPRALGYTFPAEFGAQCATWFSWPRPEGISFPGRYHRIAANLAGIVHAVALRQDVHINVLSDNWARLVQDLLIEQGVPRELCTGAGRRVFFHFMPTNECWCRDHGPAFLVKSRAGAAAQVSDVAVVDWAFNAWGGKYPPWDADDAVPTTIARRAKLRLFTSPLVMEGGSVEFNGAGTILTTTQCLLNKNRNPGASRAQIERALLDFYGQRHVVWLSEGIEGDDTDGHIDDLARFVSPSKIVVGIEDSKRDANYKQLDRALGKLFDAKDQDGQPFEIVTIPMPGVQRIAGERVPATYMNFLFVQGACLVPVFGHASEDRALTLLQDHLPKHEVVAVDCRELIWGLGAVHCLSQQVPQAKGLGARLRAMAGRVPV